MKQCSIEDRKQLQLLFTLFANVRFEAMENSPNYPKHDLATILC